MSRSRLVQNRDDKYPQTNSTILENGETIHCSDDPSEGEDTEQDVVSLKRKLHCSQQQFHILSAMHPWKYTLFSHRIEFWFPSICVVSVHFGQLPQQKSQNGRSISKTIVEFINSSDNETVAGIPQQVLPLARDWIQALVQASESYALWGDIETSSQLRSILPQFSSAVFGSVNLVRELYSLKLQQDLPFLTKVVENRSAMGLDEEMDPFTLLLQVTFLRTSSPYFVIVFGLSHTYPFGKLAHQLVGLRPSDPLLSHVEEIVTSASAGESGAGCHPISSICKALGQFLS